MLISEFQMNLPVIVDNQRLLTHGCFGTLVGHTKNAKGTILFSVQLYEGAPPVRILPANLKSEKVEKFWMWVGCIPDQANYSNDPGRDHAHFRAPTGKYTSYEAALAAGKRVSPDKPIIILESVVCYKNGFEVKL